MYMYFEKKALKEQKMKQEEKYMWVIVDGVKEKVYSSLPLSLPNQTLSPVFLENMLSVFCLEFVQLCEYTLPYIELACSMN
ncbi:putative DNA topoisomerase [Medicago truncatula]|uniref:Putative DNA topoisomerase n=1 Tax=Medicago truncatula TaxID=3880 RepID=A0A396J032_MEDTR|nr:putative DNA topoisomerase [Medicago truncatula]